MFLKKLILENIRSYTNQAINFPTSSIMLSGDIGSGKSSILQSIEFAFFGLRKKSLTGSSLLRHGENLGSVTLVFIVDENEFTIKRTLKRTKHDIKQVEGYIIENNVKTDLTPVELKAKVLDVLNYPKDLLTKSKDIIFRYTVYTPQEEMKNILTEDPMHRLNTLRKVFDVDKYKLIIESADVLVSFLKKESNILYGSVQDLEHKKNIKKEILEEKSVIEKQTSNLKKEFYDVNNGIIQKKFLMKNIENELKLLVEKRNKLTLVKESFVESDKKLKILKDKLIIVEKQLSNLDERKSNLNILEMNMDFNQVESELSKFEKEFLESNKIAAEYRAKISSTKEKISLISKDLDLGVNEKILTTENEINKFGKEVEGKNDILIKLNELQDKSKYLTEEKHKSSFALKNSEHICNKVISINNCPTCLRDLSDEYKHSLISKEKEKISSMTQLISELGEKEISLNQQISSFNELIDNTSKKELRLEVLKSELSRLKESSSKLDEKQSLIKELNDSVVSFENSLSNLQSTEHLSKKIIEHKEILKKLHHNNLIMKEIKNIGELKKEVQEKKSTIIVEINSLSEKKYNLDLEKSKLEDEIKNLLDSENKFDLLTKELESLSNNHRNIELKLNSFNAKLDMHDDNLIVLSREIFGKESNKSKLHYFKELQNWIDNHFSGLMTIIEKQILLKAYYEFNAYFQKWFNLLMEEEDMSVTLDEDFSVIVEQNGYDASFDYLSGGEKTSCALAYRLALNKVINEINSNIKTKDLIILDEPTDGFSNEQLDRVRNVLDDINIKQVIIVSHENKIESFVDDVIRINKLNHVSIVE